MSNYSFQQLSKAISRWLSGITPAEADVLIHLLGRGQLQLPFPSYLVTVDNDLPIAQMIASGRYDLVSESITANHFPSTETDVVQKVIYLIKFAGDISNADAIQEIDNLGLRPATLKELLALGAAHPDLQQSYLIAALGSTWLFNSNRVLAPCFHGSGTIRSLGLYDTSGGFTSHTRFAAVRK